MKFRIRQVGEDYPKWYVEMHNGVDWLDRANVYFSTLERAENYMNNVITQAKEDAARKADQQKEKIVKVVEV